MYNLRIVLARAILNFSRTLHRRKWTLCGTRDDGLNIFAFLFYRFNDTRACVSLRSQFNGPRTFHRFSFATCSRAKSQS